MTMLLDIDVKEVYCERAYIFHYVIDSYKLSLHRQYWHFIIPDGEIATLDSLSL